MGAAMKVNTYENIPQSLLYLRGTAISSKCISSNEIQLQNGTGRSFITLVDLLFYCISVAAIFIDTESLSLKEVVFEMISVFFYIWSFSLFFINKHLSYPSLALFYTDSVMTLGEQ